MFAWPQLTLILAAGAAAAAIVAAWLMARALVRPALMTQRKAQRVLQRTSPADLGLKYETVAFDIHDASTGGRLRIQGWWMPHDAAAGRCLLMLHGYADAKVGVIAWAPLFHAMGWNLLAVDLRAHGDSGGHLCSGGQWECEDILRVIEQLRDRLPAQTRRLALFGASLGGAVAAAVAARCDGLFAAILDSPFEDFRAASRRHMKALRLPRGPVAFLALWFAARMVRVNFAAVAPVRTIPAARCPVMVVIPECDPLIGEAAAQELEVAVASLGPRGLLWRVPGAGHLMALPADADGYAARVEAFLNTLAPAAAQHDAPGESPQDAAEARPGLA